MRNRFLNPSSWALAASTTAVLLLLGGCGSDSGTGPQPSPETGSITVTAATSGTDLDGDGYGVVVDGVPKGAIGINGSRTVDGLTAGSHTVALNGVADNCAAGDGMPQTASVTVDETAAVDFAVACVANVGTFAITTVTDGLVLDPDGYAISIDGGAPTTVSANGTTSVTVTAGSHGLELTGQAANCTPHGLPKATGTVAFGGTATVTFTLTCFQDPIVFERRQASDRNDLYVVDASGGPEVLLTDDPSTYYSFLASPAQGSAWNPTKTMIAFQSSSETNFTEYDAYVMALNKSEFHHLVQTAPQFAPTWSPDGSQLVFASYVPTGGGGWTANVLVANADLTGVTNLSQAQSWDYDLGYSADGTRILFGRDSSQVGGSSSTIWVMDANGSNKTNISNAGGTRGATEADRSGTWSPDGTRIVFTRSNYALPSQNGDLWAVDPDGGNLVQLTNTAVEESNPLWSPDGTKIYFSRCGNADCTTQDVWVMDADGANATQVTSSGGDMAGSWNATTTFAGSVAAGTALITVDMDLVNYVGRLFVQAPNGSGRAALTASGLDAENPHWR
jgi:TolB protein